MTPLHQTALLMVITSSPQLGQQHEEAGDLLQHTVPFFRRLVLTLMVNIICGVVHGVYVNLSQCFMEPGHKKCVYCVYSEQCGSNAPFTRVQVRSRCWRISLKSVTAPAPAQHQLSSAQPIFRAATEQREHLTMAVSLCLLMWQDFAHSFAFHTY